MIARNHLTGIYESLTSVFLDLAVMMDSVNNLLLIAFFKSSLVFLLNSCNFVFANKKKRAKLKVKSNNERIRFCWLWSVSIFMVYSRTTVSNV